MKIADLLRKSLTGRVSPMVYIMLALESIVRGICFLFGWLVSPQDSIIYASGTIIDTHLWGAWIAFTGAIAFYGLWNNNNEMAKLGGFTGFLGWTFATIGLITAGKWFAVIVIGLFEILFMCYIYLASSLGVINRHATREDPWGEK